MKVRPGHDPPNRFLTFAVDSGLQKPKYPNPKTLAACNDQLQRPKRHDAVQCRAGGPYSSLHVHFMTQFSRCTAVGRALAEHAFRAARSTQREAGEGQGGRIQSMRAATLGAA